MSDLDPAARRYVSRLRDELSAIPEADRADILRDIEDHFADAATAGRPTAEILTALGPAERLARAYAVELALNPGRTKVGRVDRALTVIGLVTVVSLPSFVLCVVLGALGAAFTAAGAGVTIAGFAAIVRPNLVPDLTVPAWLCLLIGPALAAAGAIVLVGLVRYIRWLVGLTLKTVRRVREQH